jgi:nucleoside-diphosphate-sugar epimerase
MNILVTGTTGFVGHALVGELLANGHSVSALVRYLSTNLPEDIIQIEIGDLGNLSVEANFFNKNKVNQHDPHSGIDDLEIELTNIDIVIHAAARVHVMKDNVSNPLHEFRRVNTDATLTLARKAAKAGVKKFIFISTIKVNGESTEGHQPFSSDDKCSPSDPYAVSKWEAECALMALAKKTSMSVVIIRSPLVYGPSVKGNFFNMVKWVEKGIPLPIGGAVQNKRSLLALDNMISFIIDCLDNPKADNEIFLLSDGEDVSTVQLIEKIAHVMGKKTRLMYIPVPFIKFFAFLFGKKMIVDRLFGTLQVDNSKAKKTSRVETSYINGGRIKKNV